MADEDEETGIGRRGATTGIIERKGLSHGGGRGAWRGREEDDLEIGSHGGDEPILPSLSVKAGIGLDTGATLNVHKGEKADERGVVAEMKRNTIVAGGNSGINEADEAGKERHGAFRTGKISDRGSGVLYVHIVVDSLPDCE